MSTLRGNGAEIIPMGNFDYWLECLAQSLEEHGVTASAGQLTAIARDVERAHECYGMAFYQPENPMIDELKEAKAALRKERDKVLCRSCSGSGRLRYNAGPWGIDTQCHKCHGEGKHAP